MQKFEIQKPFVLATLLSVATHLLLFEWLHIPHRAVKQSTAPQLLQIHLANTSAKLRHPPHSSPEEVSPEEVSPEEVSPEEVSPEEVSPDIFYEAAQLDSTPQAIEPIKFTYPNVGESFRLGGKVTLLLLIDEYGKVEDVAVIDATPPKVFDDAARAGFLNRQFQPGIKSGWPVKSKIKIEVIFPPLSEIAH